MYKYVETNFSLKLTKEFESEKYRIFRRKGRIAVKAAPPILTTYLGEKKSVE